MSRHRHRRVIASSLSTHRVYRGRKSVNVVKTLPELIVHRQAVDAAIAAMSSGDLADVVYFPRIRGGTWRENVTIRP